MEWLLVIAVLGGIGYAAVQANKFGGVTALVHQDLKQDRARLRSARSAVKELEGKVSGERESANRKLSYAQQDHERRVRAATDDLRQLREPGSGAQIDALGSVRVFEHELRIAGQTHDISGARASTEPAPDSVLLTVHLPSGERLEERFTTRSRPPADGQPTSTVVVEYSETQVTTLVDALNEQAQKHEEFVRNAPSMIAEAERTLEREREDTAHIQAAKAEIEAVERGTEASASLDRSRGDLAMVERQYEEAVQKVKDQRTGAAGSGTSSVAWVVASGSTPALALVALAAFSLMLAFSALLPWATLGESVTGLQLSGEDFYPGFGGVPMLLAGVVSAVAAGAALFGAGRIAVIGATAAAAAGSLLAVRELLVLLDGLPSASAPGISFIPIWLYLGIGAGVAASSLGAALLLPLQRISITMKHGSLAVLGCAALLAATGALPWAQERGESVTGFDLGGFEFYPGLGGQAILLTGIFAAVAAVVAMNAAPRPAIAAATVFAVIAAAIAMREMTFVLDQAQGEGSMGVGLYGAVLAAFFAIAAGSATMALPQTSRT